MEMAAKRKHKRAIALEDLCLARCVFPCDVLAPSLRTPCAKKPCIVQ